MGDIKTSTTIVGLSSTFRRKLAENVSHETRSIRRPVDIAQRPTVKELIEQAPVKIAERSEPNLTALDSPPALAVADTDTNVAEAAVVSSLIGSHYQIQGDIGEGGMAKVFAARHTKLGRMFAIKQMHATLSADKSLRRQFFREARLASSLSHPNIVSVVDFGEDPKLGAFMVMELLKGYPLSQRVRSRGHLPLRMACEVVTQVADALDYIHSKQIVHCDIKPENILICRLPTKQRRKWSVKLLDFGLARHELSGQSTMATIRGTPGYMAPETIFGEKPMPSADIYSLGVLLYELVTGQLPFTGTAPQVMRAHVSVAPKSPSETLGKPIDERLEAVILKALSKNPQDRPATMSAFIFELNTSMDMLGFRRGRQKRSTLGAPTKPSLTDQAFDLAPIGLAVVDSSGGFESANAHFRNLISDHKRPLEALDLERCKLGRLFPTLLADIKQCIAQNKTLNFRFVAKEANVRVSISIRPLSATGEHALITTEMTQID